ncbi:MAG TPA: hypothetical protein GX513_13315 [Firmicutes bacterium]|nr:hypothetical protein [Bacillota bacterium]
MDEEKLRILQMLQEGKINVEEATKLLIALNSSGTDAVAPAGRGAVGQKAITRWLRIKVSNVQTGRTTVNVNLPLSLVTVGVGIARKFVEIPELENLDLDAILEAVREGAQGKIIEVEDQEEGERVEISVE